MAKRVPAAKHTTRSGRLLKTLAHVIDFILNLEEHIMAVDKSVTDALAAQDAKLADLSAKVDAFIAAHQTNSAADNASIVSSVNAQGSVVDGIAGKLTPPA